MTRGRALAAWALAAGAGLVALGTADLAQPRGRAGAEAAVSRPLFRDFAPAAEGRGRVGDEGSEVRLAGLWPSAPAAVELTMAAKVPRAVRIAANGQAVAEAAIAPEPAVVAFTAAADAQGTLRVRVTGLRREGTVFRIVAAAVTQGPPRRVPWPRAAAYALAGLWTFWLARRAWSPPRAGWAAGGVMLAIAAAIAAARLQTLAWLPWLVGALGLGWAWLMLADAAESRLDMPRGAARWVTASLLLRVGLVAAPGFGSVDAQWHTHQLASFAAGEIVFSDAPGVALSPYPPAFYALIRPLSTGDFAHDERLVRLAMGLLEGTAPLLVLALMRAAGARAAAPAAAVVMAVMPEGLLVLAKGIAANILGSFATLLFLIAALRRAHPAIRAGLLALVFLSHAPAALSVTLLVLVWWGQEAAGHAVGTRDALRWAGMLAAAALMAWLAYYREVPLVLQDFAATASDPGVLAVRWYRAGKAAQDLVLKFGLGPVALAIAGLRAADTPPVLKRLLHAWLLTAGALGLAALVSRFPLRFEYFALPAVAAAAGLGAERWRAGGHATRVGVAWTVSMAIQVAIGLLCLAGRFEIISVILESPRWPFPVRW